MTGIASPFGALGELPASPTPSALATQGCRCGAGPHPTDPGRCAAGHVIPGNQAATVTGAHSSVFWAAQEGARKAIVASVVQDAGHTPSDAPQALLLAADGLAQAALVRDSAFARMVEQAGPITSSGRSRRSFQVWLAAADRVEKYARLVGLKRTSRPVDPLHALARAVEAVNEA